MGSEMVCDPISKDEEKRFLDKRRRELDEAVNALFDDEDDALDDAANSIVECQHISKQIKGKQKMILKNTIDRNAESEWRVCIDKMNISRTRSNIVAACPTNIHFIDADSPFALRISINCILQNHLLFAFDLFAYVL